MAEVFLKIVNMSISAAWLILAVLVLRILLKKAPKWVPVLLWGIVAVRLLCPVSIESALSLMPSGETFPEQVISGPDFNIQSGIPPVDDPVNNYLDDHYFEGVTVPANHGSNVMTILTIVWLLGVAGLMIYTAVSYFRLNLSVRTATKLYSNVYQSAQIPSPFVLGILRPRIYLPFGMKEGDMAHVIAHEQTHICRLDHWWKPLGFLLLTIHWFNPLMWVAYILLCRDIELACDEKVIAALGRDQRADYSQALLSCSVDRKMIAACPLAFGEVGVKERVKNVLHYKKPAFWIIVTAVVLCGILAVCFLTDPKPSREFVMNGNNVADIDPHKITDAIARIEDLEDGSELDVNTHNFGIHLTGNFEWDNSQTIRFFYDKDHQQYSAQLRIFPEDRKFFVTETDPIPEEKKSYKLRHYLQALKYLPQDEIREMCPDADGYIIDQRAEGRPGDYDRVITYTINGPQEIDGWFIHLELQPLHAADGAYRGSGTEVIHLFFRDSVAEVDSGASKLSVISIVDRTVTEQLPTDEAVEVFYEDAQYMYSFASIRSHLVMVSYSDGSSEDIKTALEAGRVTISDLDRFGIHYYIDPKTVLMEPTQNNLRGLVAGYLFTPINGATYRYALTDQNPAGVTVDRRLDAFSEGGPVDGIAWEIYSLKEYPDRTKLLLSGSNSAWLCEYAPARQAEEEALQAAREAGVVIVEDAWLSGNKDVWQTFHEATQKGTPGVVSVAHYHTLDAARTDSETYEAYRQDYPALYLLNLSYDGETFVLRTEEDVRTYEYLMKYTISGTPSVSSGEHEVISYYVLTHDNMVTWEQLWNGLISSAAGAYIDHYMICMERS